MGSPRAVWPALLWAAVILFLCLLPGSNLPEWDWFALLDLDKLVHAGMFFVQTVLLARLFIARAEPAKWMFWSVVISAGFGMATELMQGLEVLGRRTDINDVIANTIGSFLAGWYAHSRVKMGKPVLPDLPGQDDRS